MATATNVTPSVLLAILLLSASTAHGGSGRVRANALGTDLRELAVLQAMNLVIAEGEYNGSVIIVLGRNARYHEVGEMPVVGGSGLFRFARGYAQVRTRSFSGKSVAVLHS